MPSVFDLLGTDHQGVKRMLAELGKARPPRPAPATIT